MSNNNINIDECKGCPFYGVIDEKEDSLEWGCTRVSCAIVVNTNMGKMPMEDYLEQKANSFGFETYQDMLESHFRFVF